MGQRFLHQRKTPLNKICCIKLPCYSPEVAQMMYHLVNELLFLTRRRPRCIDILYYCHGVALLRRALDRI